MALGFTLADVPRRVSWRALLAFVSHAPRESALFRVAGPKAAQWGDMEYLTAVLIDLTQTAVWMQSKDGQSGRNRPKPIRRPGQVDADRKFGKAHMTLAEARQWQLERRASTPPMKLVEEVS